MSRATDLLLQCIDGKWTLLVEEPLLDPTPPCVLCEEYLNSGYHTCADCPVFVETGRSVCHDTPFDDWLDSFDSKNEDKIRAAAQAEQDWLRALYEKLMKEEEAA